MSQSEKAVRFVGAFEPGLATLVFADVRSGRCYYHLETSIDLPTG